MRVNLKSLGCRLNEAELETWAREFQDDGHRIVDDTDEADLLVFNSCAVTQDAVRKSRNLLRKACRANPGAKIVVSGCYASLNTEEAAALGVDLVIANTDKHRLVKIARERLSFPSMPAQATDPGESALFRLGRHRAFIKIQDGCRYRCTYCIVTVARGEERSRNPAKIVEEINRLHAQGIQEAVLTGVHLGGYGSDSGSTLTALIQTVLEQTAIPRLRLGSLEPWDIPESFVDLFDNPRLMPHLHLPLQSGSDTVLKRMARRCKTAEYRALVKRLRARVPDINLTTDVIAGFPGETESEWAETLAFVEAIGFGHIHVFSFSPRAGTAAAEMPSPVHGAIRKARSRTLHEVAERQKREFAARQLGRTLPVLWEGTRRTNGGDTLIFGYTPNYLKVGMPLSVEDGARLSYTISPAQLTVVADSGDYLRGQTALVP
ncbi:MAG: tRNA (N(6)-L-threonylcarbamoyladenosine(37)-C(2))-methylthiotransferase MtaB [Methylococcaceae bacterium]|nr:tRNA (N(6)-L-threonylcarbamoyladenosine(37)-C(2))-methylthiotransferase MtaB [Methylococcaceae bacterium]